jgi:hypothetical protein
MELSGQLHAADTLPPYSVGEQLRQCRARAPPGKGKELRARDRKCGQVRCIEPSQELGYASPPLVAVSSQTNAICPRCFSEMHFNAILPCGGVFPCGLPTKTLYALLLSPMRTVRTADQPASSDEQHFPRRRVPCPLLHCRTHGLLV